MSSATIDQGFAAWLKAEQLLLTLDSLVAARWQAIGAKAAERASPFATATGALAEAQRRLAWSGPVAVDKAVVPGERRDLIGACVTLQASALGYAAGGEAVLVIGVEEQENATTVLTVLRRLT